MYLDKLWDICYTFTNDKIANPKGEFHMKVPISLIIDDPAPVISVYKAHSPGALTNDGREIIPAFPNSLLFDFCDVVEAYGIKGKFSIVPMPGNKGDIRYKIEGVSEEDMREWIDTVKSRLVPSFTVGPEMLTHYKAVDLISGNALEIDEREWAKNQDRSTLTPYIVKALSILNQVGFDAHGVTSPWDFGSTVESEYVASIANAVYEVTGKSESWYFLHTLRNSKNMKPWVAYDEDGKTVISIPSTTMDAFWPTKDTAQCSDEYVLSIADKLINSDGTEGEIIRILNDGGYPILLTHWQSLMSNGLGTGIKALKTVASRVEKYLSDRVEWKSFDEIMQIVLSNKSAFTKPECVK